MSRLPIDKSPTLAFRSGQQCRYDGESWFTRSSTVCRVSEAEDELLTAETDITRSTRKTKELNGHGLSQVHRRQMTTHRNGERNRVTG